MSVTIVRGDCLAAMEGIPDGAVDLVLTDPPYGTTACKWDAVIPFEPMWAQVKRVLKRNGAAVFTASQPFTSALVMSNPKQFRHAWVWSKGKAANFPQVKRHPLKVHEDVLVFGCASSTYAPIMTDGKVRKKGGYSTSNSHVAVSAGAPQKVDGLYYPKSIVAFSIADNKQSGMHPTQKPVALMEYLIRTYTNEGETVLDFTMGSGTTAVACLNTGRNFIGIERDEGYFLTARERIASVIAAAEQADLFALP